MLKKLVLLSVCLAITQMAGAMCKDRATTPVRKVEFKSMKNRAKKHNKKGKSVRQQTVDILKKKFNELSTEQKEQFRERVKAKVITLSPKERQNLLTSLKTHKSS